MIIFFLLLSDKLIISLIISILKSFSNFTRSTLSLEYIIVVPSNNFSSFSISVRVIVLLAKKLISQFWML